MQALSSHLRLCESKLSSWNNFFQSCRMRGPNRKASDKKASAKSTPPRGTHFLEFLSDSKYNSVHISLDKTFFKILKKLFIVQKLMLPHMKAFGLFIEKRLKEIFWTIPRYKFSWIIDRLGNVLPQVSHGITTFD